jgi:hypothetical protein
VEVVTLAEVQELAVAAGVVQVAIAQQLEHLVEIVPLKALFN